MSVVLSMYNRLSPLPLGKQIFSFAFSQKAPYFATVRPVFTEVRPNYAELRIAKRRKVHNHIKTVHVIAIANGLEAAMGALAESTVPADKRWIPKGMSLEYTAMANSDITCTAETDPSDWLGTGDLPVKVTATREDGTVVVQGVINLYISQKPSKGADSAPTAAAAKAG